MFPASSAIPEICLGRDLHIIRRKDKEKSKKERTDLGKCIAPISDCRINMQEIILGIFTSSFLVHIPVTHI